MVGSLYDSKGGFVIEFAAAFIVAVLSGMGVGSGGLFVIWLAMTTDLPQLTSQGLNLLFFLFASGASMLVHLTKRKILWGVVAILVTSGVFGSFFGSFTAGILPTSAIRMIFGAVLFLSGLYSLFKKPKEAKKSLQKR